MLNQGITWAAKNVDASSSSSQPVIGFPVISGLLISGVIILVGLLYCCCRWNRNRVLRQSSLDGAYLEEVITVDQSHLKSKLKYTDDNMSQRQNESIPVSMPGDEMPKFIALPSPLEPPREVEMKKKITIYPQPNISNTSSRCTMVTITASR